MNPFQGLEEYRKYLSLGAEITAALAVPILIGWWIDANYGTSPWGILIGIMLGVVGVANTFYKLIRELQ